MNTKQVACIVLLALMAAVIQLGLVFRQKARAVAEEVRAEEEKEKAQLTLRDVELRALVDIRTQSADLLAFAQLWEPHFAIFEREQTAETMISMKIRADRLTAIQQRFQQAPYERSGSSTLKSVTRASLSFEDSYARLLNWLGEVEQSHPTMRVWSLAMTKGSRGEDVSMDVVLDAPTRNKK